MSWEWSHTADGVDNARDQVSVLPTETLRVVWAEWKALEPLSAENGSCAERGFDEAAYEQALLEAADIGDDILADEIWEWTEAMRTCTTGGWEAWICPWGCHRVPFDPVEDDEDDGEDEESDVDPYVVCNFCGEPVPESGLREHLERHNPCACSFAWDDVIGCFSAGTGQ